MSEKVEETDGKGRGYNSPCSEEGVQQEDRPISLISIHAKEQLQMDHGKNYQDHLTKFCVLRPVKSKRSTEIAAQPHGQLSLLSAPAILQSDNGIEFTAHVISEIKDFWPALVMVHGKARHPQSQGSVERANGDIKDMLVVWLDSSSRSLQHIWLADNDSHDWVTSIKCVQFQKNSAHHSGIKRSPCSALFGEEGQGTQE